MKYFVKNRLVSHVLFFMGIGCSVSGLSQETSVPTQLRCDLLLQTDYQSACGFIVPTEWKAVQSGKHECVKILTQTPSFGWNLSGDEPEVMQTAYQILVASTEDGLKENQGDVWDSGKVISAQSSGILYDGKPLVGDRLYFWKVRIWNENQVESAYSDVAVFLTDRNLQKHATARYPLQKQQEMPVCVRNLNDNTLVADFGKAAFCGQLYLTLTSDSDRDTVVVHTGEANTPSGTVNRMPGGSIRYCRYSLPLRSGTHTYQIQFRHGGGSIKMPGYIGEVVPFRYVELENYRGNAKQALLVRNAVYYPYNEEASYFESSDSILT